MKKKLCTIEIEDRSQKIPPFYTITETILSPLSQSDAGNSYILVAGDYFTQWMEAYPIPNQEATTVAKKLMESMFSRFSMPEQIQSNQDRQFEAKLLQEVCKQQDIRKIYIAPYHPQSDGLVE